MAHQPTCPVASGFVPMYRGHDIDACTCHQREPKTHAHCKSPGCMELGTFQPYDEHPHVLFCDKHGTQLIANCVKLFLVG